MKGCRFLSMAAAGGQGRRARARVAHAAIRAQSGRDWFMRHSNGLGLTCFSRSGSPRKAGDSIMISLRKTAIVTLTSLSVVATALPPRHSPAPARPAVDTLAPRRRGRPNIAQYRGYRGYRGYPAAGYRRGHNAAPWSQARSASAFWARPRQRRQAARSMPIPTTTAITMAVRPTGMAARSTSLPARIMARATGYWGHDFRDYRLSLPARSCLQSGSGRPARPA